MSNQDLSLTHVTPQSVYCELTPRLCLVPPEEYESAVITVLGVIYDPPHPAVQCGSLAWNESSVEWFVCHGSIVLIGLCLNPYKFRAIDYIRKEY